MLTLIGIFTMAACLTGIMQGIADDAEKRRLKRRAKYRRKAYADVYRRRVKDSNREALWSEVNR